MFCSSSSTWGSSSNAPSVLDLIAKAGEGDYELKVKRPWPWGKPQVVLVPTSGTSSWYGSFKAYLFPNQVKAARQMAWKQVSREIQFQYPQLGETQFLEEAQKIDLSCQTLDDFITKKGVTLNFVKNFLAQDQQMKSALSERRSSLTDSTRRSSEASALTSVATSEQQQVPEPELEPMSESKEVKKDPQAEKKNYQERFQFLRKNFEGFIDEDCDIGTNEKIKGLEKLSDGLSKLSKQIDAGEPLQSEIKQLQDRIRTASQLQRVTQNFEGIIDEDCDIGVDEKAEELEKLSRDLSALSDNLNKDQQLLPLQAELQRFQTRINNAINEKEHLSASDFRQSSVSSLTRSESRSEFRLDEEDEDSDDEDEDSMNVNKQVATQEIPLDSAVESLIKMDNLGQEEITLLNKGKFLTKVESEKVEIPGAMFGGYEVSAFTITSYAWLAGVAPQAAMNVIRDAKTNGPKLIQNCSKCEISDENQSENATTDVVTYTIGIPSVMNFSVQQTRTFSTITGGGRQMKWKLAKSNLAMNSNEGSVEIVPYQGGSLIRYQTKITPTASTAAFIKSEKLQAITNNTLLAFKMLCASLA